jgi:hypothetical protein
MSAKDDRLYAKFTLDFADHEKIMPLSSDAFRCLVEATLWSRRLQTDGLLPRRLAVARWSLEILTELCENDDEKPSLIEVEKGWLIRDFAEHQDTKAEIEARRAQAKAAGQLGGLAKAKRPAKRPAKRTVSAPLSKSLAETETETVSVVAKNGGEVTLGNAPDRNGADAPPPPPTLSGKPVNGGPSESGPEPFCHRHPNGPDHDQACRRCQAVRNHRDGPQGQNGSKVPQETTGAEERRIQRDREDYRQRMAIHHCEVPCDSDGYLDWRPRGGMRFKCPHDATLLKAEHDEQLAQLAKRQESWEAWNHQQNQQRKAAR